MGEGEKGEECFHGKSDAGWMVMLVRLFFRGGFRGRLRRKEEIVRFGNSMKMLRFCLREIVFEWQKLWVEIKSFFASSRMS